VNVGITTQHIDAMLLKKIFAVIVIVFATIAFLANAAGLIGVWAVRKPARDTVTTLSTLVNDKLGKLNDELTRVGFRAAEGREAVARINNAANQFGNRLENNSPLVTSLVDAARDDLAPKIVKLRAQAAALRDAAVSVNAALEMLNSLELVNIPTFSEELSAVSGRIDAIQDDVQDLRAKIDEARTTASANLIDAVKTRTEQVDNMMRQIQSTTNKYQTTVSQKRQQVTDLARGLVRIINLAVLTFTALFLIVAAGQVLLIYVAARSMMASPKVKLS